MSKTAASPKTTTAAAITAATQIPYAISVAAISFVMYVIAGLVQNALILLPIGVVLTVAFLFVAKAVSAKKEA